jgi:hypothetical protein
VHAPERDRIGGAHAHEERADDAGQGGGAAEAEGDAGGPRSVLLRATEDILRL